MKLAPIVLFVYNRPAHTKQTLNVLAMSKLADESILYIYADGPKKDASAEELKSIELTRKLIKEKNWCKEVHIIESEFNKGLANSIIAGVTEVVNKYDSIIVLEDDIVVAPSFLNYMNDCLIKFDEHKIIGSVNAYVDPAINFTKLPNYFLLHGADCWGWATWKDRWEDFITDAKKVKDQIIADNKIKQFDYGNTIQILDAQISGTVNSWHIRWHGTQIIKNKLGLYPNKSFVINIGEDGSGTHSDINHHKFKPEDLNKYDISINSFDFEFLLNNHKKSESSFRKLYFKKFKGTMLNKLKSKAAKTIRFLTKK